MNKTLQKAPFQRGFFFALKGHFVIFSLLGVNSTIFGKVI